MGNPKVGIVMGSDSDLKIMQDAVKVLRDFGVESELVVASAHRTPYKALQYAESAEERGIEVIIAGAGAAAHLGGVLAAVTPLPVIGVPINATALNGLDALYAMVQMPSGIPVATVAINGGKNAAWLALQIIAVSHPEIKEMLLAQRVQMEEDAMKANEEVMKHQPKID